MTRQPTAKDPDPRLSVVVPAYNAGASLAACLDALSAAAAGVDAELIVVDDASTDGTAEEAEGRAVRVLRMERVSGPSAARNLGAARARGEILLFVDADVLVHGAAIARVLEHFQRWPQSAAVFGSYDDQPRVAGMVAQYRNLVHHYVHQHGHSDASTFWAGCGAIRRAVFEELGGFDGSDYPRCIEDIELGYRLRQAGYTVHLDRELLCTHLKRWTLLSMIRTDVFCRAIPWARLERTRKMSAGDLNIKSSQKLSVALVGLALILAALGIFQPWCLAGTGVALVSILALNADLFRFFVRKRGVVFALRCVPLHLLYFLYSGLSYLAVLVADLVGLRLRDGNTRP